MLSIGDGFQNWNLSGGATLSSFLWLFGVFSVLPTDFLLKTFLVASQIFMQTVSGSFMCLSFNCTSHHPFSKANCKCWISELFYLPAVHLPLVSSFFFFYPPLFPSHIKHCLSFPRLTHSSDHHHADYWCEPWGAAWRLRPSLIMPFDCEQTECHAAAPSGQHLP